MKTAKELRLSGQEAKLYTLIWKRTMACQMDDAKLVFHTVTIGAENAEFRETSRHVGFPGFLQAYVGVSTIPKKPWTIKKPHCRRCLSR
jgi:DNA topoisomerase-1